MAVEALDPERRRTLAISAKATNSQDPYLDFQSPPQSSGLRTLDFGIVVIILGNSEVWVL